MDPLQRLGSGEGLLGQDVLALHLAAEQMQVDRQVVHQEHPQALQVGGRRGFGTAGIMQQLHFHGERRADALQALHAHGAVHGFREALHDGQAQARASVAPGGGGIRLREGIEQLPLLFRRHADAGVLHGEEAWNLPPGGRQGSARR